MWKYGGEEGEESLLLLSSFNYHLLPMLAKGLNVNCRAPNMPQGAGDVGAAWNTQCKMQPRTCFEEQTHKITTPEGISKSCKGELIVSWVYEPGQKGSWMHTLIILQQLMEELRECYTLDLLLNSNLMNMWIFFYHILQNLPIRIAQLW